MNIEQTVAGGSDRDMPPSPDPAVDPDHPTVPDPDDDPLMNEEEGGGWQEADDVPADAEPGTEQYHADASVGFVFKTKRNPARCSKRPAK